MGILETIGKQVAGAVEGLFDKNRRSALINRLRIVIKNERENSARAYVALGKYYYDNLRDRDNVETEPLCASIDESERRLQRAFDKMAALHEQAARAQDGDPCHTCTDDCNACGYNVSVHIDSDAAPYDKYDTTPSPIASDPDNVETEAVAPQPAAADAQAADEEAAPVPGDSAPKA